jgi:molybdopterin-guanine dinucleotide biosynthesis protein A
MKIVNGYILAGGKSSRMGVDKGLILFRGKPLIEYAIDQLRPVVNKVVIVSNNSEYNKFGLEVIGDIYKEIGPAGGIHAALTHSDENIFITGCDMPFITSASAEHVIDNSGDSQITLPEFEGNVEPLFGVYSKDCLVKWNDLIQGRIIKLQTMIEYFDLVKINVEQNPLFKNNLFANLNSKNDFEKQDYSQVS